MKCTYLATGTLIAVLGSSGQANAVSQLRLKTQSAVGNCQVSLPRAGDPLRKRPLGMINDGASTTFVSCSWSAETRGSTGINSIAVFFVNHGAADLALSCTLVDGSPVPVGVSTFFPRARFVQVGNSVSLQWFARENAGINFKTPSVSCGVPPGIEIDLTLVDYDTDVGV